MHHFHNAMMLAADRLQNGVAKPRIGTVSAYDPNTFMVKVNLQPENIETGWLQLGSPMVGNQFGVFCAPMISDQVEVQFIDGDLSSGVVSMRFFNDAARPLNVPAGECWIVHKSGSCIKFHNDGTVEMHTQSDMNATIGGNLNATVTGNIVSSAANWNHTGPLNVTGNINATQTITGQNDVIGGGKSLKSHVHSGVASGSSNTGAPV